MPTKNSPQNLSRNTSKGHEPKSVIRSLLAILACLSFGISIQAPQGASPAKGTLDKFGVSGAAIDQQGFLSHTVECDYQEGRTEIKVLLPDRLEKDKRYPVLYVLPVETGNGTQFGHGLLEVKRLNLHNKYGLICVYPTFAQSSWYADTDINPKVSYESYVLKVLLPCIEDRYPVVRERKGRLLVGFSKSGWGAFSLLLRHPDLFERAAAWDAPLAETHPDSSKKLKEKFGTAQNFQNYRIDLLLKRRAGLLQKEKRLILMGYGGQRELYLDTHALMVSLKIPHEYLDGWPPARTQVG